MYNSKITGLGYFVPENVVTNDDLKEWMETSDEWIRERTGIKERRWIDPTTGETTSTMAVKAAKIAIKRANLTKDDIDFIVFATLSPDMYFPGGGVRVQDMLDLPTIGALDVRNQCSGFVYAMSVADQFIKTGMYKNILVIGSENHSGGLDKSTRGRGVTVIFGDGAGAVILSAESGNGDKSDRGILASDLNSDGRLKDILYVDGGVSTQSTGYLRMHGKEVYRHAIEKLATTAENSMKTAGVTIDEIDWIVSHQATIRIIHGTAKIMGIPKERILTTVQDHDNTSAASIHLALSVSKTDGFLKKNDLIVTEAIGGGLAWGSLIIRW